MGTCGTLLVEFSTARQGAGRSNPGGVTDGHGSSPGGLAVPSSVVSGKPIGAFRVIHALGARVGEVILRQIVFDCQVSFGYGQATPDSIATANQKES